MTYQTEQITSTLRLSTGLGFCSGSGSDTFRSILIHGKEKEPRKNYFKIVQNNFTFLRGFDRKNTYFEILRNLIRKGCFQMTLNTRQSPAESLSQIKNDDNRANF